MLLDAKNVRKSFGRTQALKDGSLQVEAGEIHGLLGSNGAGKSTLVKILAGVVQRDSGTISVSGTELPEQVHARAVRELGISFIHQDLGLIGEMSVAENIALGLGFPSRGPLVSGSELRAQARRHLEELGVEVDPRTELRLLNGADQALVAIARAVVDGARLVVLDEPTARLRGSEVDRLFAQLDVLRKRSVGFIYVTHRLEEVFTVTDRVTVFRNGETVATSATADLTEDELISQIVGRAWVSETHTHQNTSAVADDGEVALRVTDLVTDELDGFSLEVHAGEVVGITGPAGTGSSLARVIAGIDSGEAGTVRVFGEDGVRSPREAVMRRIAYIPADRREDGLAVEMSIGENLACGNYTQSERPGVGRMRRWARPAPPRRERKLAAELIERFEIKAPDGDTLVSRLSGGNQQKVLLAKWLQAAPKLLILDEPTQGVDVGTRREIYAMVDELVAGGVPLLVVSADFQELAELCDRVVVIRGRRVGTILEAERVTQDEIAAESYRTAETVAPAPGAEGGEA